MVDVNTQNKTISVNVSSSGVSSNVNASGDTAMYYSNKSKEWAISNRIVDGVDYSSKYYANKSNQSALNAQSFAQSALETLNNVDSKVQEATNIAKEEIQEVSATEQAELEEIRDDVINYAGIYYEEITDEVVDVNLLESGYVLDSELEEALATKQDKGDYALKEEIPSIEGLATQQQLTEGLNTKQPKGNYALVDDVPTLVSELENDSNYATQTQVMQAIASIPQFSLSIVDELPLAGEKMTLYLVPKEGTNNDVYDEYIWIEQTSSFEHLGTTAVDLTDYVKNTDYATTDSGIGGVIKTSAYYGTIVNSYGYLICAHKTLDAYNKGDNAMFIAKGTLENIKDDYVKRAVTANNIELTDDEKTSACNWLGTAKTVSLTEADYDALATKDANTLYLIEE